MKIEELVEYYQSEACHYLAIALTKQTGLRLGIIWNNEEDDWGQGEERSPIHCVVTNGVYILDSRGVRPIEEALDHYHDIPREQLAFDNDVSMEELTALCGDDRPLYAITEEYLLEATQAVAVLGLLEKGQSTMEFAND